MNTHSTPEDGGTHGSPESEALLESIRAGILRRALEKFKEAKDKENERPGITYIQHAPVDTADEDVYAIMLTRDGKRPFREEADIKEQLILYFTPDSENMVYIEHIREGIRKKSVLDRYGLLQYGEPDETFGSELFAEQVSEEITTAADDMRQSETSRLGALREKIDRFLLTPQN